MTKPFIEGSGIGGYTDAMMPRSFLTAILMGSALSVGFSLPSMAQVTDQTDQSEEDWRKSRKKSGSSDIYRSPNTSSTGLGLPSITYDPPTPLERLPSESRRHIMRERAKAIAGSPDGDISNVAYTPSEAAQSDPQLRQDEQEAWDDMTSPGDADQSVEATDPSASQGGASQGQNPGQSQSAGQGQSQGQGQENGQSDPSSQSTTQGPRGGSAASLQDIMNAIKSGQSSGQSGQSQSDASDQGQGQSQSTGASVSEASEGSSESGSAAEGSDTQGSSAQSDGSQTSEANGDGDKDGGDAGGGNAVGSESSQGQQGDGSSSNTNEALSPLELIRRSKDDRAAEGRKRSASDYLGQESDQTPNR